MMFFKSTIILSALLALASAVALEPKAISSQMSVVVDGDHKAHSAIRVPSFSVKKSDCEEEDEADCKEFCSLSQQTATCAANGNKVTCYCKGGKAPESNCEERCLLCMPGKSALEEARRLFKLGGTKIDEL